ncbi:uroporphyrinogen decarboxylase [Paracoccaceae bacterium GXU_MW_L88]
MTKLLLRALNGETLPTPPIWLMRQAGRYLPEYRATRAKAGGFLDLCYTPELAAEVTLQPIRRFELDAAILFADILLVPQALGLDLWFEPGEGPRLSTITDSKGVDALRPVDEIDATLSPIYETVKILRQELPKETPLIGFAGAPWTVATYMIAGRGTKDQAPARAMIYRDQAAFDRLMNRVTEATIHYLRQQILAGAEVVKIFDSWAGSLPGGLFDRYALAPAKTITAALRAEFPDVPVIGFPRGAGGNYLKFAKESGVQGMGLDTNVCPKWAAENLQPHLCVQGNLDPLLMVKGGDALTRTAREIRDALSGGPHILNLGHGITPEADPENVARLIDAIRT